MAQFENYLERKKQNQEMQYRWDQEEKELPKQKYEVGMDSYDLIDYYENRMEQTAFAERTKYYFEDAGLLASKSKRYFNISEGGANVEEFAAQHKNHSADKRKKSANKAATAFGKAAILADKYNKKKSKDFYEVYTRREEIMRLRMEGMEQAAETKSTSKNNEIYLKSKAKISCLMILMDQLRNLSKMAKLKGDTKSLQKLQKKGTSIKKELMKAQDDMRENILRTDLKWKEENGINEFQAINMVESARIETGNHRIVEDDVKTRMSYKTLKVHMARYKMKPPCHVVRLDRKGQPISLTEAKKKAWNDRYNEALENGDQETINEMNLEALRRIEKYDFPDPASLQKYDMNTLFRFHPAEYLEKFMNMPQFIKAHQKEGDPIKQYIEEHPVLKRKIEFMNVMCDYMTESLMSAHIAVANGEYSRFDHTISKGRFQEYSGKLRTAYQKLDQAVKKEQGEKEKLDPKIQTLAEQKTEYEKLKRTNPGFTKGGYQLYKGFFEENKTYLNPEYVKITSDYQKIYNKKNNKSDNLELSRTFGAMLRAVHLDKDGKPISEADKRKKAQNDRWMNSWVEKENETEEEKQQREATQREIVEKEAETIFKGFTFPEPADLKKWTKEMLTKKPFAFAEMLKRALAVDKLAELCPAMREYRDTHPVFQKKLAVAFALNSMTPQFTKSYYGVNTAVLAGAEVVDEATQLDSKQSFEDAGSPMGYEQQHLLGYTEQFNKLRPMQLKEQQDKKTAEEQARRELQNKAAKYKADKRKVNVNANGE